MIAAAASHRLPPLWKAAVAAASVAMLAWVVWHAVDATLGAAQMQTSHQAAAQRHDRLLRLESELQLSAQIGIATGDNGRLSEHETVERDLRATIGELLHAETQPPQRTHLTQALAAIDALSRIEAEALARVGAGQQQAVLDLIAGPDYRSSLASLSSNLRHFDALYHDWALRQTTGLTTPELTSLGVALLLFAAVIGAWLVVLRHLQGERLALLGEIERRQSAEQAMLQAQKDHVLGQLAGSIAHDVNNVLSAAAGYADLAGRADDSEARQSALDGLGKAVDQGRGLTRNLLAFTRQQQAVLCPLELGRFVRETEAWIGPLLPPAIAISIDDRSIRELWIEADRVQLQQAFVNLALNARDAMPQGGSLEIRLCRRQFASVDRAKALACLSLTDTGCGMEAQVLARARDPLFTTKPSGHGVGLGLAAVLRIVESHGGELQIESVPGLGTSVRMLLPLCARPVLPGSDRGEYHALVVSADPYSRELLCAALAELDIKVRGLARIEASTRFAAGIEPDVIIIDHKGSDADALNLMREIGAGNNRAPVILIAEITDAEIENELAAMVSLVSGPAALAELAALAVRLAAATVTRAAV